MGKIQQDAALLKRVKAGEMDACRILMDANLKPMLGLAYRMLGDVAEAEDIAQEAFLRLWKQAPNWRAEAQIRVWLYRVVYNLCIDRIRKLKPVSGKEAPEEAEEAGQLATLHGGEVFDRLHSAILALPERQRLAITLVHIQEERQKDVAEIMEISVDALESLLARGKRGLKAKLGKHKDEMIGGLS